MELPRGKVITVEKEASLPIWIPEKVEDWDIVEVVGDELVHRDWKALSKISSIFYLSFKNDLREIPRFSPAGWRGLVSIDLPATLEHIDAELFASCLSLISINVDPNNESFHSEGGVLYRRGSHKELIAYPANRRARSFVCDARSIGARAFAGAHELRGLHLTRAMTIGARAFERSALTHITLASSLRELSDEAFIGATKLERIDVEDGCRAFTSRDGVLYTRGMASIVCYPRARGGHEFICEEARSVGAHAFTGVRELRLVSLPNVRELGERVFCNCPQLWAIQLPRVLGCKPGSRAITNCTRLRNLALPDIVPMNLLDEIDTGIAPRPGLPLRLIVSDGDEYRRLQETGELGWRYEIVSQDA